MKVNFKFEKLETYSNLAYPLAGIIGYWLHQHEFFLMIMVVMGGGSAIFHQFKEGNLEIYRADWFAIHLTLNTLTGLLMDKFVIWIGLAVFSVIYCFFIMGNVKGKLRVYIEVSLSAIPAIIACFMNKSIQDTMIILVLFLIAIYIRAKDPDSDQTDHHDSWEHSLWHVLTAVGFYLILFL